MHKKVLALCAILPMFFLSSCSKNLLPAAKEPVLNFSSTGSFLENENMVNFNLRAQESNDIFLEITSPKGAEGLTFKKQNGNIAVNYKNLEIKNDSHNIIFGSSIADILDVLERFAQKNALNIISTENGVSTYSGSNENGNFEIDLFDSSGFIKELRFLKHNLVVNFSDHENL